MEDGRPRLGRAALPLLMRTARATGEDASAGFDLRIVGRYFDNPLDLSLHSRFLPVRTGMSRHEVAYGAG